MSLDFSKLNKTIETLKAKDTLKRVRAEVILRGEMFEDCTLDEFVKAVDSVLVSHDELAKRCDALQAIVDVRSKQSENESQEKTSCNDNQITDLAEQQIKKEMRQALSRKFFKLEKEDYDVNDSCEIDKLDTVISDMLNIYQFLFPKDEK